MSGHPSKSNSLLELSPGGDKYLPREMTPEVAARQAAMILEFVRRWKEELQAKVDALPEE